MMNYKEIFESYKNIAVVGMSRHLSKPSFTVPSFMKKQGYNVIPVNPLADSILKVKAYPNLLAIPDRIDIVNVFRPSENAVEIVKEAIKRRNEKGDVELIWLQLGIHNEEAKHLAMQNDIEYLEDVCMYVAYNEVV
ncbi:CoA-binding protein [Candidatus Kapabacteria bacterium]|nr:CoA-binding protein [Candidatus Kapabacteria bacterium]